MLFLLFQISSIKKEEKILSCVFVFLSVFCAYTFEHTACVKNRVLFQYKEYNGDWFLHAHTKSEYTWANGNNAWKYYSLVHSRYHSNKSYSESIHSEIYVVSFRMLPNPLHTNRSITVESLWFRHKALDRSEWAGSPLFVNLFMFNHTLFDWSFFPLGARGMCVFIDVKYKNCPIFFLHSNKRWFV